MNRVAWQDAALATLLVLAPAAARAQSAAAVPLTLREAVQRAIQHYPALRESRARAQAAEAGVSVARAAYLPRLDLVWQENRATHNNVFGLLLPQPVLPSLSGPVLGTRSPNSVWGSAAGALLAWDALDFGQRRAAVDVARAQSVQAKARTELTELDVAASAADAFLTVVASDEGVRAATANVDRLQVLADSVRTLVANQLRPGADESRANAELAIAKNQLSQAGQTAEIARASLAEAIGAAGTSVEPAVIGLDTLPAIDGLPAPDLKSHPAALAQRAAVDAVQARQRVLDHGYMPRVTLQSALFGRGTGALVPGQPSFGNGLWLQVPNWAAGVSVSFPALEILSLRARKAVEVQNALAESARYDQTTQALTTQEAKARALMHAALDIARNTPLERQAATDAESRARARYQNGLANITEVAEATRLLAQAETDAAVARLSVWRALLALSQVRGDLKPFLDRVDRP